MQDIEDMCLLLTSSTSFIDQPFQEHRMTEKHHMDQNPYISSICPKQGVVSDNMTRGDDVAKSMGPPDLRWGQPGFGTNEITLLTRVMLSWLEEDPRWESRCGHETWLSGLPT
jgi:hypothetical protein